MTVDHDPRPALLSEPGHPRPARLRVPTDPPPPPVVRHTRPVPVPLTRATGPGPVAPGRPAATQPIVSDVVSLPAPARAPSGSPAAPVSRRAARRAARTAATGADRTDRFDRGLLAVLGAALAAAGILGLLLDHGTLRWSSPGRTYRRLAADATGSVDLAAAIAMAACLVVTLMGLRWALAQLRPVRDDGPRLARITIPGSTRGGTTLAPAVLSRAAAADVARIAGVASARVRLHTLRPVPMALVVVELHLDADLTELDGRIRDSLERLARTVDVGPVEAEVRIRFARSRQPAGSRAR